MASICQRIPLPVVIADTCAKFFGSRAKKWSDNRCGACPIAVPCRAKHAEPSPTIEQLDDNRRTFIAESLAILGTEAK